MKLTVGAGDALRSVSLSAGRPRGVNVCVCDNIFGFLIAAAGVSRLVASLFPNDSFFSAAEDAPSGMRSPGGGIPVRKNEKVLTLNP